MSSTYSCLVMMKTKYPVMNKNGFNVLPCSDFVTHIRKKSQINRTIIILQFRISELVRQVLQPSGFMFPLYITH